MSKPEERMKLNSSALLADAVALLRAAKCPHCDGSGCIPRQISPRQRVTREMASDAGCPEMEGSLYSDDEWVAEQCQWCDERSRLLEQYETIGRPISHDEAMRIARETLETAERERIEVARAEAERGIQYTEETGD
ncbi:MAG TPA: hypothetical protein VM223_14455 [Planctomycetota bacterium]|nr:hypothetical protein [Planctomycetota bacterium]